MEEWGCNPERVAVTATAIEASNPKQRQLHDFAPAANPFKNPLRSPQPNADTTHRFAECPSFVIRIHHFCGYPCQLLDDFLLTSDSPDSTINTNLAALALLLPLFVSKFIWGPADPLLRYIIPLNPSHLPFLSFSLQELYRSLRH